MWAPELQEQTQSISRLVVIQGNQTRA